MSMGVKKTAIIIGAGPAGLSAGVKLVRAGYNVTVLESDERYIGGIARTQEYKGYHFDMGPHRFFTKNKEVMSLWNEMLGKELRMRKRSTPWLFKGKYFDYPISITEVLRKFGPLFALRILLGYVYRRIFPINPVKNLTDWYKNSFGDFLAGPFFIHYNERLWGCSCDELSVDFAVQRIKGISLIKTVISSLKKMLGQGSNVKSFIGSFHYPDFGSGQMWDTLGKVITRSGGKILKGHTVVKLHARGKRITMVESVFKGKKVIFKPDFVLSTMPFRELALMISPVLSKAAVRAAQQLKFRDYIIVILIVDRKNVCPHNWMYLHDKGIRALRLDNFNNFSPHMSKASNKTIIGMEYTCNPGDDFWTKNDEELIRIGKNDFLRLGLAIDSNICDGTVARQRNAYPIYDLGYSNRVEKIRAEIEKFTNLYPLGRGGLHKYNNMDHSVATALVVTENILEGRQKYDVFNINSDAEYHEEQKK